MNTSPHPVPVDTATPHPDSVAEQSRTRWEPLYRTVIGTLPAKLAQIIEYHRGWADTAGRPGGMRGGAIRPALVFASARSISGNRDSGAAVAAAAVAVELVHDFTLLHDDVMDGDRFRRDREAAWVRFGTAHAVLAGDTLLALAVGLMAEQLPTAMVALTRTLRLLCEGQSADLSSDREQDFDIEAYRRMASYKTGALIEAACVLGAHAAAADDEQRQRLRVFGEHFGIAYQVADDLRNIWADPASTGKPSMSDLQRRKKTLPVVFALQSDTAAGREFRLRYSAAGQTDADQVSELAVLIERAGGRRHAEEYLARCCAQARDAIEPLADTQDLHNFVGSTEHWL